MVMAMAVGLYVVPATADRFADLETMLGPKKPGATVCWCLSHRIDPKTNQSLRPDERRAYVERLCHQPISPGVLAYSGDDVVGWSGVAPREQVHSVAANARIPRIDDLPTWSIWCLKVRAGHRRRGVAKALIAGAVEYARANGAAAVEAYPADTGGARIDTTMAFIGTRRLFESAGFVKVADTDSVAAGKPRVIMRFAGT